MKKPRAKPRPKPAPVVAAPEPVPEPTPEVADVPFEPENEKDLVPIAARIKRADAHRLNRHQERIQAQRPMAIVGISEPIREAIGHGLDVMDARHPVKGAEGK